LILLVASRKDPASVNITRHILENHPLKPQVEGAREAYVGKVGEQEVKLIVLDEELIYAQNIADCQPSSELIVFLSRHSSESAVPTLSVHTPGNLGEAKFGGLPRKISISPANAMRTALMTMAKLVAERRLNYKVSYECTHHGPSLDKPAMFVELGSSPKQWEDVEAAEIVAHAVMEVVLNFGKNEAKAVLGIGGPHYNEKFTKAALESNIAFGHIIPKYVIHEIDEEILKQCVDRTLERVELAVLDWKGIKGGDKKHLERVLAEVGLKIQKV
jgi:D-aminoacyl-tRNA deacylase